MFIIVGGAVDRFGIGIALNKGTPNKLNYPVSCELAYWYRS